MGHKSSSGCPLVSKKSFILKKKKSSEKSNKDDPDQLLYRSWTNGMLQYQAEMLQRNVMEGYEAICLEGDQWMIALRLFPRHHTIHHCQRGDSGCCGCAVWRAVAVLCFAVECWDVTEHGLLFKWRPEMSNKERCQKSQSQQSPLRGKELITVGSTTWFSIQ